MKGKTLKLFLPNGTFNDIVFTEISNFTGKIITVPRFNVAKLSNRKELKKTGIYILAGTDVRSSNQTSIYIGRSENLYGRLKQHNIESKMFWDRAALIFSKDRSLTQGHIDYLEKKLIKLATDFSSSILTNVQSSELPNLPDSDISDMEFFLDEVKLILSVVGFNYFAATPKTTDNLLFFPQEESAVQNSPLFYMNILNTDAYAKIIDGKFVVLKDSLARNRCVDSLADTYRKLRDRLILEEKLTYDSLRSKLIFTQDVYFNSPTSAAAVTSGSNLSGRTCFKIKDTNVTYGAWYRQSKIDTRWIESKK